MKGRRQVLPMLNPSKLGKLTGDWSSATQLSTFSQDRNTHHERGGKDTSCYREVLAFCDCESKRSEFSPAEVIQLTRGATYVDSVYQTSPHFHRMPSWHHLCVVERQSELPHGPVPTYGMAKLIVAYPETPLRSIHKRDLLVKHHPSVGVTWTTDCCVPLEKTRVLAQWVI
jgi:hypothetical protein